MRSARILLLPLFTVACLTAINLSEAKNPNKTGGGGGGGGSATLEYGIFQLDSDEGAFSGFAADVNDVGSVVGEVADTATGEKFAAHWDVTVGADGTVTSSLSVLPGSIGTRATGANNLGEVVGDAPLLGGPGLYWPSVEVDPLLLQPLDGDTDAQPSGINDAGIIGGTSIYYESTPEGAIQEEHPVVWRVTSDSNGNPVVVGPFALPCTYGRAWDLSEADADGTVTVAGKAWDSQSNAAVTWRVQPQPNGGVSIDPQPTILQFNVNVRGINNTGIVCGDSSRPDWIAMLWTATEEIPLALPRKFDYSSAEDLNDAGITVGWVGDQIGGILGEPAVWTGPDANPALLNSFLSRKSPFDYLTDAPAINEAGVIVGAGWDGDEGITQAFIAVPK